MIIQNNIILKLKNSLEYGENISPYFIERKEEDNIVVWYGINTNWKFENNKWYKLENNEFVECKKPEYEYLYEQLYINKLNIWKILIKKI